MTGRPRILFLTHRVPYPPNRGDRIRSYHLLRFLAQRADVSLASIADEPTLPGTLHVLRGLCQQVAIEQVGLSRWPRGMWSLARGKSATQGLFWSSRLARTVGQWAQGKQFDAVVVFCSSMVQYAELSELRSVPAVIDLVDVDSQKFAAYAQRGTFLKRWLYRIEQQQLQNLECSLPAKVRAITLVSEVEAELYRSICPNDRTHAVGNGVDLDYFSPSTNDEVPGRCAFVGVMDYPPNIDAVLWFCREVWPHVRAGRPDATFVIVGRNPTAEVQALARIDGVEVTGSVADVRPHVATASVVVVPLRIARGVQNKLLESLAMGKAVIASPAALEGVAVEPEVDGLSAESPESWTSSLLELFSNSERRRSLGEHGRRLVERDHNWEQCLSLFGELVLPTTLTPCNAAKLQTAGAPA